VTEDAQQELERVKGMEFGHRRKLANLCEAVMVRVVELEEIDANSDGGTKCGEIARKLRAAVVANT